MIDRGLDWLAHFPRLEITHCRGITLHDAEPTWRMLRLVRSSYALSKLIFKRIRLRRAIKSQDFVAFSSESRKLYWFKGMHSPPLTVSMLN